jgi:hypothetical protein
VDPRLLKYFHEILCLFSAQGASGTLLVCGFQEDSQKGAYFIIILRMGGVKVSSSKGRWSL